MTRHFAKRYLLLASVLQKRWRDGLWIDIFDVAESIVVWNFENIGTAADIEYVPMGFCIPSPLYAEWSIMNTNQSIMVCGIVKTTRVFNVILSIGF
jgi:hypothetical protein